MTIESIINTYTLFFCLKFPIFLIFLNLLFFSEIILISYITWGLGIGDWGLE